MRFVPVRPITLAICVGLAVWLAGGAHAQDSAAAEFDDDFAQEPAATSEPAAVAAEATQAPADEEIAPAADTPAARERDDTTSFVHNTIEGLTGGVHAVDARSGKPRSFRFAVAFDYFKNTGWLAPGSEHRHGGSALSLNVTPIEHLELAAQLSVVGHADEAGTPSVIQVVGDARLSAKGYASIKRWLAVGGDMEFTLLNAIGALGYQPSATSVGLRGNATFDLRNLERRVPLIVRTSMRYYFDNSSKLIRNVEEARYAALANPAPPESEYRHLLTNVERVAYGINRTDFFGLGFGFELPFAPRADLLFSPLLEWAVSVPVNRQDYSCLLTNAPNDRDGCLASEGFSARPSTMTFGLRTQPMVPGLGVLLAIDVATSGMRTFVRELAPNAPYSLYLGLSYSYELFVKHQAPPPVYERVEVPIEKVRGHVQGEIAEKQAGTPIARALIHFEGTPLSDIATDANGKFVSYPLDPGPVQLAVSADGYEPALCSTTLPSDFSDVALRCELVALPKNGSLRGRVLDAQSKPVAGAKISLSGPSPLTLDSDSAGGFAQESLPAGQYEARVEASGFLVQVVPLTVRDKSESAPVFTLLPKPARSLVQLTPKRIAIKQQVQFVAGSAEIDPASTALLSEIADVLLRNAGIARVEVQGHTDNSGTEASNKELSERRAQAVREWLVKAGVSDDRLTAEGYGSSRPLAPNITAQNRARNRRVELVILEMR
jgi:outer membrane protein OmpA-like peptidoglycan-associated protein